MHDTATDNLTGPGSPTPPDPLIRIRGLRKRFGDIPALRGVDLELHGGSILALLGQNGAGPAVTGTVSP